MVGTRRHEMLTSINYTVTEMHLVLRRANLVEEMTSGA